VEPVSTEESGTPVAPGLLPGAPPGIASSIHPFLNEAGGHLQDQNRHGLPVPGQHKDIKEYFEKIG
jgi:hypothetical protein